MSDADPARGGSGNISIWDTDTDQLIATLPGVILTGDSFTNNALEWSPDGTRLASVSDDGHVYIWNMDTYAQVAVYDGYQSIILED